MGDDVLYSRAACTALVITCSDFRFKSVERTFMDLAGLVNDYDLIARPGAIRSLVSARSDAARESMEEEIAMLRKLHGFILASRVAGKAIGGEILVSSLVRALVESNVDAGTFGEPREVELKG